MDVSRRLAVTVFLVALAIRVLYLLDIRDNPFFDSPVIDAQFYRDLGAALARGEGTGRAPFMMPPLYPLLLAGLFRLPGLGLLPELPLPALTGGPPLLLAHIVQILLGATTAVLTALLGRRLGGPRVGLVAGLLVATSQALLYVEGDLLATPLGVCLDLAFLLFLVRFVASERRGDLVLAGLAAGLAALAVPTVLVSVAAACVAFLWRRRWVAAALLAGVTFLPILPVTLYNRQASGTLVPISANGGINFYIGNNPDMRQTVALRPGPAWRRMNDLPLREAGVVTAAGRDRWFYAAGLGFWREQPGVALRHSLEKLVLLLHDHELMRDFDFEYFRRHYSRLLRLPGLGFAMLLGLAVVGVGAARRRTAGENVLLVFLFSYGLGVVAFFVAARYRAPLIPVLAVFAAMGAAWAWTRAQERRWRSLGLAGLAAAAAFSFSRIDWYGVDGVDEVEAVYRVGQALQQQGDCDAALQQFEAVLQRAPRHALAAAHAAMCEQQLGRLQAAVDRYERLLAVHPDYVEPMVNLANIAWSHGDSASAVHYYELAIATDPWFAQAHGYYGLYLLAQAAPRQAVSKLGRALALDPGWEALRLDLARAHLEAGEPERALREVQTAAEVMPPTDALELLRGDALFGLGRDDEARAAWQRGLRRNPANAELQRRLR